MEDHDFQGTYAPQSPDLSGYQSFDQPTSFPQPYTSPPRYPSNHQQPVYQQPDPYSANQNQPFDPFAPEHSALEGPQQKLPSMLKGRKGRAHHDDEPYNPDHPQPKANRPPKKQKVEEEVCTVPAPGAMEGVDVKTKFPVARIKRIMQADEDVGKVSQVTPTAVSKALELFIISLTLESTKIARAKSSRRVTASHLKQAVVGNDQLDFLEQIVSKVPDAPTSKAEAKRKGGVTEEEDSSDDSFVESKVKKKGTGPRKRRGRGADDD